MSLQAGSTSLTAERITGVWNTCNISFALTIPWIGKIYRSDTGKPGIGVRLSSNRRLLPMPTTNNIQWARVDS
jgi:hypothetical protein